MGFLQSLVAGDYCLAAGDCLVDARGGQYLAIQEDSNGPAYIHAGQHGKLLSPLRAEFQGYYILSLLVSLLTGILQIRTVENGFPFLILEFQHSGLADYLDCLIRVLDARQLHDNPAVALALHDRLCQAKLINTLLHDAHHPLHGILIHLCLRRILRFQHHMGTALQVQALPDGGCQRGYKGEEYGNDD